MTDRSRQQNMLDSIYAAAFARHFQLGMEEHYMKSGRPDYMPDPEDRMKVRQLVAIEAMAAANDAMISYAAALETNYTTGQPRPTRLPEDSPDQLSWLDDPFPEPTMAVRSVLYWTGSSWSKEPADCKSFASVDEAKASFAEQAHGVSLGYGVPLLLVPGAKPDTLILVNTDMASR